MPDRFEDIPRGLEPLATPGFVRLFSGRENRVFRYLIRFWPQDHANQEPSDDVPAEQPERAQASPIWYLP